jgi:hypothetical protein
MAIACRHPHDRGLKSALWESCWCVTRCHHAHHTRWRGCSLSWGFTWCAGATDNVWIHARRGHPTGRASRAWVGGCKDWRIHVWGWSEQTEMAFPPLLLRRFFAQQVKGCCFQASYRRVLLQWPTDHYCTVINWSLLYPSIWNGHFQNVIVMCVLVN